VKYSTPRESGRVQQWKNERVKEWELHFLNESGELLQVSDEVLQFRVAGFVVWCAQDRRGMHGGHDGYDAD